MYGPPDGDRQTTWLVETSPLPPGRIAMNGLLR